MGLLLNVISPNVHFNTTITYSNIWEKKSFILNTKYSLKNRNTVKALAAKVANVGLDIISFHSIPTQTNLGHQAVIHMYGRFS